MPTSMDRDDKLKTVLKFLPWHRRFATKLILWSEAIWPIVMPGLALIAFWLGLATLGVFEPYPGLGLLAFIITLGLAGYLGHRQAGVTTYPNDRDILRRLERDNGLVHRPFTSLTDDLATDDSAVARALWARHVARIRAAKPTRLILGELRTNSARRDPYALRFAAALLAIVGFAVAGIDAERRLLNAVSLSGLSLDLGSGTVTLDAWIAPPDYTGLPPVFLSRGDQAGSADELDQDTLLATPTGSTVFARITAPNLSAERPPTLRIGDQEIAFEPADPGQFNLTYSLDLTALTPPATAEDAETANAEDDDGRQRVTVGFKAGRSGLGDWDILVTPDLAPSMVLSDSPTVSDDQLVEIPYAAIDDYGLTAVTAALSLIAPVEGRETPPLMDEIIAQAPEGRSLGDRLITTARQDMIAHPWAGLEIAIELTAQDALGQSAVSERDTLILPMRNFTNPVARAIIEHRQTLTLRPRSGPPEIARELRNLAADPDAFNGDTVVIIGLAALATRLDINRTETSIATAQQLMWELALRLEDGQLGIAQRALERAASELADALEADSDATSEEIQELLDAYEEAMQEFMNTLREEMMERLARGETLPEIPEGMEQEILNPQEMAEMLEQLRDMAETGSREAAREMLSQLEEMMESLRQGEIAEPSEEEQQLRELAQRIQDLTREQQELMDDTFRGRPSTPLEVLRERLPPGMDIPQGFELSDPDLRAQQEQERDQARTRSEERAIQNMNRSLEQEALRQELGDIMVELIESIDELPPNLGNAEQAMRGSTDALQNNRTARALQNMGEALEELEQLQNDLQDRAQSMAGGPGGRPQLRFGTAPSGGRAPGTDEGLDPLGRDMDSQGRGTGSDVEVPGESDLQRARAILEELRRRAGEFDRPEEELDYIERLLDRF